MRLLQRANDDPKVQALIKAHSANNIIDWFNLWAWTYDPRLVGRHDATPSLPFDLWPIQERFVHFFEAKLANREEWLAEKSRDMGASYLMAGIAVHKWLFVPGFKTTFGSNKEKNVDSRDNPDSIFEKQRIILRRLPVWMLPEDFDWSSHDLYMRLINPETGATVTGEAGDNMGRGGRCSMYVVDEAAFVERADKIQAAVAGAADCIGWVSSANGNGNLFYRKRHNLRPDQVFTLHYSEDPRKDAAWVEKKQGEIDDPAIWASEYEIDYAASVEGTCIIGSWVKAAQNIGKLLAERGYKIHRPAHGLGGLDVGAGKAKSIFIGRFGPLVNEPESRSDPDTTETAHWALECARGARIKTINYDAPGVGVGVTSGFKHAEHADVDVYPINTGVPPSTRVWADERTSDEMFDNLKGEIWWLARAAFNRTYRMYLWLTTDGVKGHEYPLSEIIILGSGSSLWQKLATELSIPRWFKNEKGKIIIEKKDQLRTRGVASPDFADALMLTFIEIPDDGIGGIVVDTESFHRDNPFTVGIGG